MYKYLKIVSKTAGKIIMLRAEFKNLFQLSKMLTIASHLRL